MRKIVLTYGLISGTILSAIMATSMLLHERLGINFEAGLVIGYTSMVAAFLMVYFGVRSYRDNVAGGEIRFWPAFKAGMLIVLIAATMYVATWQVIYDKVWPDYSERYAEQVLAKARQRGASEAELAARRSELAEFAEQYRNPLIRIAYTYLEPLPVGLLISLVTAGVLSRRRRREHGEPATA